MTYSDILAQAFDSIRRTIPKMGTNVPCIGNADLTYARCARDFWVEGFWSGQLWLAYDETKDAVFMEAARAQRPYFFQRLDRPESHDHDLGFLYSLSLVADYKLTGDDDACQGALRADSLAAL
jgi:unsaturated chondroitin disaccharide hydrolase